MTCRIESATLGADDEPLLHRRGRYDGPRRTDPERGQRVSRSVSAAITRSLDLGPGEVDRPLAAETAGRRTVVPRRPGPRVEQASDSTSGAITVRVTCAGAGS